MTNTHDERVQLVQDCIDRESRLTARERGFIDNIDRKLAGDRVLSDHQAGTLDAIWERVT